MYEKIIIILFLISINLYSETGKSLNSSVLFMPILKSTENNNIPISLNINFDTSIIGIGIISNFQKTSEYIFKSFKLDEYKYSLGAEYSKLKIGMSLEKELYFAIETSQSFIGLKLNKIYFEALLNSKNPRIGIGIGIGVGD